ncbi:MAG: hypothetical protein NT027_19560 [Proteobacteria bacterium]|nr:hypothetical protein [Pseudomonadota bacterium]
MMRLGLITSIHFLILFSCTPALHLHEGDRFYFPYVSATPIPKNDKGAAVDLSQLTLGKKVSIDKCGDSSHQYNNMGELKPIFDKLITEAQMQSGAILLKEASITVKPLNCVGLEALAMH